MNRTLLFLLIFGTTLALGGLFALVRMGTPPPLSSPQGSVGAHDTAERSGFSADRGFPLQKSPQNQGQTASLPQGSSTDQTPRGANGSGVLRPQATAFSNATHHPLDAAGKPILTPEQEIEAANQIGAASQEPAGFTQDPFAEEVARFAFTDDSNTIRSESEITNIDQKIAEKLAKKEEKLRDKNGQINGEETEASETSATSATPALDAFQVALGYQGTDKFSYGKVLKAVQGMHEHEFPQAAAQLEGLEWNKESHYMMNALMKQWGKTDLDAALNAADTMDIRRMQSDARREAMAGWSSHNPDEAYRMLLGGEDQNPLAEYVSPAKVFKDLAQSNPQAALDKVWNLPETRQQNSALAGVLSALPADERQTAARSLYQQAPTPESQSMLARAVVNDLRIYRPTEAAAFVDSIQEPAIRKSASSTLISSWATDDPTEAMGWAASHAPSEQTERDVSSVASRWVRNDRNEFGNWLNQQPATATLDPAVQVLVRAEQKESPSTAMGWAESIVDPKDRVSSVRSVAAAWMKTDPAIATPYILNHAELTDKEKQKLLR